MDELKPAPATSEQIQTQAYRKGTFSERFVAFLLDGILTFVVQVLLGFVFGLLSGHNANAFARYLGYLFSFLYTFLFLGLQGATPGMRVLKLKLLNTSYKPITLATSFIRILASILSSFLYLGYFWMLIDKKKQTWHDKLAGTYVVTLDYKGSLIPDTEPEVVTRGNKLLFSLFVVLFSLCIGSVTVFLITYMFFFRPFQVNGQSMAPTLHDKEYFLINVRSVNAGSLKHGDIVTFQSSTNRTKDLVKRIIGLPGDTIMLQNGDVYLNGRLLDERSYLLRNGRTYGGAFLADDQSITVPKGKYFVLGDNRLESADSREWGFVPTEDIIGTYMFCYFNCK